MKTYFEILDAMNSAKTENNHTYQRGALDGYRAAREEMGCPASYIDADLHTMEIYGTDRPMCAGELLDWEPEQNPDLGDGGD